VERQAHFQTTEVTQPLVRVQMRAGASHSPDFKITVSSPVILPLTAMIPSKVPLGLPGHSVSGARYLKMPDARTQYETRQG
jgi:hypothetical protein